MVNQEKIPAVNASYGEQVIRIRDAVVTYREDVALRGVSLTIRKGSLVGIIGPNGAGKTTVLTLINGLGKLIEGQVEVLGRPVHQNATALRKLIGYVPQIQKIDPRMPVNVREVVMMGRCGRLGLLRRPGPHDWEIVDRMIRNVSLDHLSERPIGHLSGGEQQRVAIARAMAQEPQLLLLDEPTASLDRHVRKEILSLIREIHRQNKLTTLLVTHELGAVSSLCDWVVLMEAGRIRMQGRPETVMDPQLLDDVFGEQ